MVVNLIKLFFPFRSSWTLIFFEISIASIIAGIVYESGLTSIVMFFGLLALTLNRLGSFLISIIFALIFFHHLLLSVGYITGMPLEEVILVMTANILYQIASAILIIIILYKHVKSSILLRSQIIKVGSIFSRIRYREPLFTEPPLTEPPLIRQPVLQKPMNINLTYGHSLDNDRVKIYTNKILNYLVPNNQIQTNIHIEEVQQLERGNFGGIRSKDSKTAGTASRRGNDINIKIANIVFGQASVEEKMVTLAHELVHAKQYITGELQFDKWKGTPESNYLHLPYRETPWEEEAYRLQEYLYERFWI